MKKQYKYKDQTFDDAYSVRQALYKTEKLSFGPEPDENKAEFWETFGVEYSEIDNYEEEFNELKQEKLFELNECFNNYLTSKNTFIQTSLGFKVNANQTAYTNIDGLIFQTEAKGSQNTENTTTAFNDFENEIRTLTTEQLKTIKLEISENISRAYSLKWKYREEINKSTTIEELMGMQFSFDANNFEEIE